MRIPVLLIAGLIAWIWMREAIGWARCLAMVVALGGVTLMVTGGSGGTGSAGNGDIKPATDKALTFRGVLCGMLLTVNINPFLLLAHIGSFVPAALARIGPIDRILTRIGAGDDLARGQSTFMVEMSETSYILHHATEHSLVLMDEIGRGTSTFDGLALAWAIARQLVDRVIVQEVA